jgi:hypothetical protein
MAGANLPAKKYKHSTPTQLRLVFQFAEGETGGYIDLAQCLSAINRRMYRQGCYYYINSLEVETLQDGYVEVAVAPDTWTVQQAWKRGFAIFQKMNGMVDTPRPSYHDYKVYLDANHRDDIQQGNLNRLPIGVGTIGNIDSFESDEWNYAQYVNFNDRIPESEGTTSHQTTPNQFNAHLIGFHQGTGTSSWASVGLVKSYKESRLLPVIGGQPEVPTGNDDDPLNLLFQGSEVHALEEIQQHLDVMNDTTPYDRDTYPGEKQNHLIPLERLYTSGNPAGRTHKVSGACVPLGLMRVSSVGYAQGWRLIINVASGTYNGVYAERV